MTGYDVVDEAIIDAPPDAVWDELVAELGGARRWWVPHTTFESGELGGPVDRVGGEIRWTVHTRGVDNGGMKLRFTSRTSAVRPARRWAGDYVAGAFRGSYLLALEPVGAARTRLWLRWRALPQGKLKLLSKAVDMGEEHSKAARNAFVQLGARFGVPAELPDGERRIRTDDGAELAVTVRGSGPAVVLAHGWGGGRGTWGPVADRLVGDGHTVVSYDLRGHGASTRGGEPIGAERLGRDLGTVVDQLGLADVVVAGHSGGAFGAMAWAASADGAGGATGPARADGAPETAGPAWAASAGAAASATGPAKADGAPDTAGPARAASGAAGRVRGLVLVSTAAHDQDTSGPEAFLMGSRFVSFVTRRRRLGARFLRQTLGRSPERATLDATRAMFAATPARVRGECFRSSRGMDLRPQLAALAVPAVVLHGDADRVIPTALGEAVAETLPDARFELVPGAGHMLPLEAPDDVAEAVAKLAAG